MAFGHHRLRQRLEQRMEVEGLAFLGDEAVEAFDEAVVARVGEDAIERPSARRLRPPTAA